MWRMRLCALYCVATPKRRMPVEGVRQREVDDARLAAEEHRRLGALVGEFHQPAAAPAGQHESHGVAGDRRRHAEGLGPGSRFDDGDAHGVSPRVLRGLVCLAAG
jgi:hypothetical protein